MIAATPLALVTGAPGWLGTRLVEVLLKGLADVPALAEPLGGRRIRCLVQRSADPSALRALGERVELVEGDVADPASLEPFFMKAGGATLFHCAGVVHPSRGTRQFFQVNSRGTEHIVKGAERAGMRRLVHVSSNSPIGTNPSNDHLFDESSPYNPYMGYGKSKMLAERAVLSAKERGKLQVVIIRPPWFYGPNHPPRQNLFFEMVRDGKVPLVGDGENRRSMAYIDNICQGLLLCERVEQANGGIYWIADRRPYSMNEIIATIESALESDFDIKCAHNRWRLPGVMGGVAWWVDKGLQTAGLYHQKVHVLSEMNRTIACSVARAERELGFDPRIELREGMRRSIQWILDQGGRL